MKKLAKTKRAIKSQKRPSKSRDLSKLDPLGGDWHPGQPSKYKPEFCEKIILHCHKGLTFEEFASDIGVHLDTLYECASKHPDFALAKKRAKQESLIYMMKLGRTSLLGERIGPEGKSRNVNWPLWIFQMKARFGWREESPEQDDGDVEFEYE
jgi:hypothetical protein